jgi:O-antigen/teichoic acid export membrane protein
VANEGESDGVTSREVAKGAGTTLLARLSNVIDVVAQPVYVWMFGLASFGLYSVLWAAINLIENTADLGMTSALQRTVPQARSEEDAVASLRAALVMGVMPCLLIAAVVTFIAPNLTHLFNANAADAPQLSLAIALFVWALPLWAFIEVSTGVLCARRVFGAEIRLRMFWEQLVRLGFAVFFWLIGLGTMSLFYAHLLSLAIICVLCVRLLSRNYHLGLMFAAQGHRGMWGETLKAGLAVLPTNVVGRLFGDGPPLVLNTLIPGAGGATAAGLYTIVRKISSLVQLVRLTFAYVLSPLASLASTERSNAVPEIYGYATRLSLVIVAPMGAVLAAGSAALLHLFGREADAAIPALAILIMVRVGEAIFGAAGPIQQVIGGYLGQQAGSVAGLAAAAIAGLFLMPAGGLTGMAIAVGVGIIVSTIVPLAQLLYYEKIHPFAAPFPSVGLRAAIVAIGGFAAALTIRLVPANVQLVPLTLILIAAIWGSCRLALPLADRQSLGKAARLLRLV